MARYDLIAVYLVASQPNGTLYLGVTSDLLQRGLDFAASTRTSSGRFAATSSIEEEVWRSSRSASSTHESSARSSHGVTRSSSMEELSVSGAN
ncbi:hypothetical protein U91I_01138 [alpha proteobacterium U9-1i]|nr:hypothetical protein U91I_01138 [alpha proteobacterium U9-1i]